MKKPSCSLTSFKDLKDALECRNYTLRDVASPVRKDHSACESDEEVFRKAMADVREIKEFREIPVKPSPSLAPRSARGEDVCEILRQIVDGKARMRLSDTGEYMEWTSPRVRRDITKRLHGGSFAVQDCIDLHGMILSEAEEAIRAFLGEAVRRRLFCVKVIHGRGLRSPNGPVLKEALKTWLHGTFSKWVLAYATARDRDGGLGATYILLR